MEGGGDFKNRWLGHPCGQRDWDCPKDSFPPLKRGVPSFEKHVGWTDAWLKLSMPWSPGVALIPLGSLSLCGPGCTGGTCSMRERTLTSKLIEFHGLCHQLF